MATSTATAAILVAWAAPPFIGAIVVIGLVQYWLAQGFITTTRDLKRIESTTRSPIISSFSELVSRTTLHVNFTCKPHAQVNGITTVRAFGAERFFLNHMFERLDINMAADYYCECYLIYNAPFCSLTQSFNFSLVRTASFNPSATNIVHYYRMCNRW